MPPVFVAENVYRPRAAMCMGKLLFGKGAFGTLCLQHADGVYDWQTASTCGGQCLHTIDHKSYGSRVNGVASGVKCAHSCRLGAFGRQGALHGQPEGPLAPKRAAGGYDGGHIRYTCTCTYRVQSMCRDVPGGVAQPGHRYTLGVHFTYVHICMLYVNSAPPPPPPGVGVQCPTMHILQWMPLRLPVHSTRVPANHRNCGPWTLSAPSRRGVLIVDSLGMYTRSSNIWEGGQRPPSPTTVR